MTSDADLASRAAPAVEPRRRTFTISTPNGPGELAALEFGDPDRRGGDVARRRDSRGIRARGRIWIQEKEPRGYFFFFWLS